MQALVDLLYLFEKYQFNKSMGFLVNAVACAILLDVLALKLSGMPLWRLIRFKLPMLLQGLAQPIERSTPLRPFTRKIMYLITKCSAAYLCAVSALFSFIAGYFFVMGGSQLALSSSLILLACTLILAYVTLYMYVGFKRI